VTFHAGPERISNLLAILPVPQSLLSVAIPNQHQGCHHL